MSERGRTRLQVVKPAPAAPIDITLTMRAEIKARDWGKVHVEADRRAPFSFWPRRWSWSNPAPQGRRGRG